jgi:hypothetical protein
MDEIIADRYGRRRKKILGNRRFYGRIWMSVDVHLVTPTGIEPVFQP